MAGEPACKLKSRQCVNKEGVGFYGIVTDYFFHDIALAQKNWPRNPSIRLLATT